MVMELMFRILTIVFAAVFAPGVFGYGSAMSADQRFDVSIHDQNVRDVFEEISSATGVPVILSENVNGRVSADFEQATVPEMLDTLSDLRALDWRMDNGRIRVTSQNEQTTRIIDLDGIPLLQLTNALKSLGVYSNRFKMTAVEKQFGMVAGPPDYIALVEVVLGALVNTRDKKAEESATAERQRKEYEQLILKQQYELEQFKLERDRLRAEQLERERLRYRGPRLVRNGVWGG